MNLGIWLGLGICCSLTVAQPAFPPVQGPQFRAAREQSPNREAGGRFYFGVMGQVARPGVYELDNSQPELLEVLRHAGGLTRQSTGQIWIVREGHAGQTVHYSPTLYFPLIPGDILVADSLPMTKSAETFRHVALLDVHDRPVILPVPDRHANLAAILAYLGQHPATASTVKIQPVGAGTNARPFSVPTVLYFEPALLDRDRLPELPGVFRVTANGEIRPPAPLDSTGQFQRPEVFIEASSSAQIPKPASPVPQELFSPGSITTDPAADEKPSADAGAEPERKKTSWWTYAGLILLVLVPAGAYLRRRRLSPVPPVPPILERPASPSPQPGKSRVRFELPVHQSIRPKSGTAIGDEVLEALMLDRLPVFEESLEEAVPFASEESVPEPERTQKQFRLDPPEERSSLVRKPNVLKPSKRPDRAKPAPPERPATLPLPRKSQPAEPAPLAESEENRPGPGLLDRVLKQVHQNRAA